MYVSTLTCVLAEEKQGCKYKLTHFFGGPKFRYFMLASYPFIYTSEENNNPKMFQISNCKMQHLAQVSSCHETCKSQNL